jgi:hypothetical protein
MLQLARVVANQNHEGHQGNTKYSREKPSCNLRVLRGFSFSFFTPLHLYVSDSPEIEIELQSEWVTHNACYDA